MKEKDSFFLNNEQALEAICFDLRQYDPQILLLSEIIRLISEGRTILKRDQQKNGVWICEAGRRNMRWLSGPELVEYACDLLASMDKNPEMLSSICSRVFRTQAAPAEDPNTSQTGIRIETGMETFSCRQCGQCCQSLDYQNGVTVEDVTRWEEQGRTDILQWVGVFKRDGKVTGYRMWMTPGTRELAAQCPFLQKLPAENRWICRIHDVKPTICREYPVSRKHALMTGCPGFEGSHLNERDG